MLKDISEPTVPPKPKMISITRTEVHSEATLLSLRKTYLATMKDCIARIEEIDKALGQDGAQCGCHHG